MIFYLNAAVYARPEPPAPTVGSATETAQSGWSQEWVCWARGDQSEQSFACSTRKLDQVCNMPEP